MSGITPAKASAASPVPDKVSPDPPLRRGPPNYEPVNNFNSLAIGNYSTPWYSSTIQPAMVNDGLRSSIPSKAKSSPP